MGPLWLGQGTVPHCTVSDIFSFNRLFNPSGALVGAEKKYLLISKLHVYQLPSVKVVVEDETVLLIPIPSYTATTLIVQLLHAGIKRIKGVN